MAISIGPRLTDATGGTTSDITGYKVHTFTSNGTFTPTQNGRVEVLVVGGGGGGGGPSTSGGGGAGSIVYKKYHSVTASTPYSVTVGSGGNKAPNSGNKTTFTSSNTYTATGTGTVEVLIVGGGGGAGTSPSPDYGGAGAGSVLYKKFQPVTKDTAYTCIVGAGGNLNLQGPGSSGNDTVAFGVTAYGGAGPSEPGDDNLPRANKSCSNPVGSGGGGRRSEQGGLGAGVIGYGFAGADNRGGGGGAGGEAASPGNDNPSWPNHVGPGLTYSISGSPVVYGRGGGAIDSSLMPIPEAAAYDAGYGFGGDADDYPGSYDPYGGSGPDRRFARGRPGVVIIRDSGGTPGNDSTVFGLTASGGSGESKSNPAGSGGGLSFRDTSSDSPITLPGTLSGGTGADVVNEGYSGGDANPSSGAGGGGGGVIDAGQPSPGGGAGGSGYSSSISGTVSTYSHGGPAGNVSDPTYIPGNYGNGGKGNSNGTDGVVIIRYVS